MILKKTEGFLLSNDAVKYDYHVVPGVSQFLGRERSPR